MSLLGAGIYIALIVNGRGTGSTYMLIFLNG